MRCCGPLQLWQYYLQRRDGSHTHVNLWQFQDVDDVQPFALAVALAPSPANVAAPSLVRCATVSAPITNALGKFDRAGACARAVTWGSGTRGDNQAGAAAPTKTRVAWISGASPTSTHTKNT